MKVVFLTYHFPPDAAVGALRAGRVAAALRRHGHWTEVFAAAPRDALPSGGGDVARADPGSARPEDGAASAQTRATRVTRVRPRPAARDHYLALKSAVRRLIGHAGRRADAQFAEGYVAPKRNPAWKRYLVSVLVIPDSQRGFVLPAVRRALRASRAADVVYTSGPPHSTHLAGLLLKVLGGVRWVAEFRDPWTDNPQKSANVRSRFSDYLVMRMERLCLHRADRIVVVSEAARRLFTGKVSDEVARRIVLVRNGVPELPAAVPARTSAGEFRIVYLGTLGQSRDPRPLLDALAALRRRGVEHATDVHVDFIGRCKWYYEVSVAEYAQRIGLGEVVRVHEPVPHAKCAELLASADLLLLLAQQQPAQVPNKLYEYMAARRPILAFAEAESETADVLASVGAGHYVVADERPETVERVLERALRDGPGRTVTYDADVVAALSAERQMDLLVRELETLTGERARDTLAGQGGALDSLQVAPGGVIAGVES
jgi:glycosyltransferase involved in cell wall biosynthesis